MANSFFTFKQFTVQQDRSAMKVTTDGCLFAAWVAERLCTQSHERKVDVAHHLLDVGTGTGLCSLMLAQKTEASITAIEIDDNACTQARENVAASAWKDRIDVIHGDVRQLDLTNQYDTIVCNPPFYERELHSPDIKRNLAHHGSELSLTELLEVIRSGLKPSGVFYLLLPIKRQAACEELLHAMGLYIQKRVLVKQTVAHEHFRVMIEGRGEQVAEMTTSELSIKNKDNEYTDEFTALLKDYYLYM